ncbi:MAG: ATP-binding cassette domain-containing protein [Clostridiales bacterium]|nr:ATP-binding cassette domain-containing protein [Clostridiales bacterium]
MEYILETFDLSKRYGNNWVLKKVNMHIAKGDVYGFVGENGSGKTTVIRLVTGLISPNEGHSALFGVSDRTKDILRVRRKVGAIVEKPSIYLNMCALDNLKMQCGILGITENVQEKIQQALKDVGLEEQFGTKKSAGDFSLGMRQRLGIAMALLGEPELIILDEPMNGLDPAGIVEIRELIIKLNREKNITFLISSHILTELSLVATKYGIISKGELVKEITAQELKNECRPTVQINTPDREKLCALLSELLPSDCFLPTGLGAKVLGEVRLNELLQKIIDAGVEIQSVNCYESSIEDYYLSLTGGGHNA